MNKFKTSHNQEGLTTSSDFQEAVPSCLEASL